MKKENVEILSKIQVSLKVPKAQMNEFGKFKFRSCEDSLEALKPLLHSTGCAIKISDSIEVIGEKLFVKATASIIFPDGEFESTTAFAEIPREARKGMDCAMSTGASSSYSRKYCLNALFALDSSELDPDLRNEGEQKTKDNQRGNERPREAQQKRQPTPEEATKSRLLEKIRMHLGGLTAGFDAEKKTSALVAMTSCDTWKKATALPIEKIIEIIKKEGLE